MRQIRTFIGNLSGKPAMRVFARTCTEHLITGDSPINRTGEPLGGGPGYGQIVYPDLWPGPVYLPRTRDEFLELLHSYWDESGLTQDLPPWASPDSLVFLAHDLAFDLAGYHSLTIPDGVTLASDRGRELAPGIYSQGALLYSTRYWWHERGVCQAPLLQCAGAGWMTGLRLYGPGPDDSVANANETAWSGGSLGFKFPKGRTAPFEVDNCEGLYFNDMIFHGAGVVDGDSIHHCLIGDAMRNGYGYGIWPGEDAAVGAEFPAWGNLYRNCRHFVDSRKNADGSERLVFSVTDSALLGVSRREPLNTHAEDGPKGTPLSGFVRRYERLLVDVQGERIGASDPKVYTGAAVPEGGILTLDDLYASRPEGHVDTHDDPLPLGAFDPDHPLYDEDYKKGFADKVGDIYVSGIRPATDLERARLVLSLSSANPTAGAEIALEIRPSYPCAWYEVLWGDGYGVDDPAQLTRTSRMSLTHTYRESGLYTIWVQGFDGLGVPSLEATARVRVEPTHDEPELVFWVRPDWPHAYTRRTDIPYADPPFVLEVLVQEADGEVWTQDYLPGLIDGWSRFDTLAPEGDTVLPIFQVRCVRTPEPGEPQSCAFFIDDLALFGVPSAYTPGCWLSVCDGGFDATEQEVRDTWDPLPPVRGTFRVHRFGRSRGGGCLMIPSPKPIAGDVVRFEPAHAFRLKPIVPGGEVPA